MLDVREAVEDVSQRSPIPWVHLWAEEMTPAYEASLACLSARIAKRRALMESEFQLLSGQKKQLMAMLQRMESLSSAFDDEDRQCVTAQVQHHESRLCVLAQEMKEDDTKRKEREEVFRCMHSAITGRSRVLEEDDACLSAHPEMLEFFARKQISLQALLKAKMEEHCSDSQPYAQEHLFELTSHP